MEWRLKTTTPDDDAPASSTTTTTAAAAVTDHIDLMALKALGTLPFALVAEGLAIPAALGMRLQVERADKVQRFQAHQ